MFRSIVLLAGGLASLVAVSSPAQEAILGQKYGRGVHDYFSGDYLKAYEQLTAAVDGGSKDPRAFYFRGLAYLKLGRAQESVQDFQKGAGLESRDVNKFYNVSKALERVQGPARVELENYRVEARMAALEEAERLRKSRYEAIEREEARVLREQPPAPPESIKTPEASAAEKPAEPVAVPAAEPAAADLFAAPEEKPAPKAEKKPVKKEAVEPAVEESAEKSAETPAAPAGDDPFAAPATKPAKKTAVKVVEEEKEPAAKAEGADPFATEPAADEKPAKKAAKASGKKAAKAGKEEKPAADDKSDEKGNPFMDESLDNEKKSDAKDKPAAEEKEPAAEEKPAVEEKEPAADEKPAAEEKPAKGKKAIEKKSDAKKATGKKAAGKKADNEDPFAQ